MSFKFFRRGEIHREYERERGLYGDFGLLLMCSLFSDTPLTAKCVLAKVRLIVANDIPSNKIEGG